MEQRFCAECGEPLRGRIDKKFCSDPCRNTYNNKQNSNSNNYVRNINSLLRKNRRILIDNLKGEKSVIQKQRLLMDGFNFSHHTHTLTTGKGTYTFCYEYGYLPIERDLLLIVKQDPANKT